MGVGKDVCGDEWEVVQWYLNQVLWVAVVIDHEDCVKKVFPGDRVNVCS